jgi:hypothetical protein
MGAIRVLLRGFADGREEQRPLGSLDELVTERGYPGNRLGVADVSVYVNAPVLAGGVELVDTPGTGSVFEWDTAAAHAALQTMDATVFVLTADPPVSAAERDLIGKVTGSGCRQRSGRPRACASPQPLRAGARSRNSPGGRRRCGRCSPCSAGLQRRVARIVPRRVSAEAWKICASRLCRALLRAPQQSGLASGGLPKGRVHCGIGGRADRSAPGGAETSGERGPARVTCGAGTI